MSSDPFEQFTESEKQKMLSLYFKDQRETNEKKAEALKLFENHSYESAFIGAKKEVKPMEKVSDIYASTANFLNSKMVKDLKLVGKTLTVKSIDKETVGRDDQAKTKLVLTFNEIEKRLALSATNANILAEVWGDEFDPAWNGKSLQLVLTKVKFNKDLVDSIQVVPQ